MELAGGGAMASCLQGTQRLSELSKDPSQEISLWDPAKASFLSV